MRSNKLITSFIGCKNWYDNWNCNWISNWPYFIDSLLYKMLNMPKNQVMF
jgi:hypothetical protein